MKQKNEQKTRENTIHDKKKEKTKEKNINEVQSLMGGLIGLPKGDQAFIVYTQITFITAGARLVATHLTTTTSRQRSSLKLPSSLFKESISQQKPCLS